MAVLGKSLAIVSVGISCQTAHQICAHAPLIRELCGEDLQEHGTPFDWLLCPVSAATEMIRTRTFAPADLSELEGPAKPFWRQMGVHYWHKQARDGWAEAVIRNWDRIAAAKRRIFIISNTQTNVLGKLAEYNRTMEVRLLGPEIVELFWALDEVFASGKELHVVTGGTNQQRAHGVNTAANVMPSLYSHHFEHDSGHGWQGNSYAWERLFRAII